MSNNSSPGPVTTVTNGFFKFLDFMIAICLFFMVIMVFGNVVLRYAFDSGISLSEELSRWCFVWMTFIGAIIGMREHGHLGVDLLVSRFSAAGKKVCLIIAQVLMLICAVILLRGSWSQTLINLDVRAPASELSMAFIYGMGVFFSVVVILILLAELYRAVFGKLSEEELVITKASEQLKEVEEEREIEHEIEHEHEKSPPRADAGKP